MCGLRRPRSFDDLDVDNDIRERLQRLYRCVLKKMRKLSVNTFSHYSSVEDIDLYVGGTAEKPVKGGMVSETFACIIAQQFQQVRCVVALPIS